MNCQRHKHLAKFYWVIDVALFVLALDLLKEVFQNRADLLKAIPEKLEDILATTLLTKTEVGTANKFQRGHFNKPSAMFKEW